MKCQAQDVSSEGEAQDVRHVDMKSLKLGHINEDIESSIRGDIHVKAK